MSNEGTTLGNYIGFLHYLGNYIETTGGAPVTSARKVKAAPGKAAARAAASASGWRNTKAKKLATPSAA